jgi:hypothetical protein
MLEAQGGDSDLTAEELRENLPQSFFMDRCRLTVRPKEQIIELIVQVLELFKTTKYRVKADPSRGLAEREVPLVSERTMRVWEDLKEHIMKGCLNDPEGVEAYVLKHNAPQVSILLHTWPPPSQLNLAPWQSASIRERFYSLRSTSHNEGWHHWYEEAVPGDHTGLALQQALSQERVFSWNQEAGVSHRGSLRCPSRGDIHDDFS